MKEILISGYYGFKNSDDDALLSCIIKDIEKVYDRDKIVVLSANPEETTRLYNIRSIDRMNIFSIIAHMGNASLLVSGGGTLIQDGTSTKSLLYYLGIIMLAKFFGLRTMLYANGIGPLIREKNKKRTKKVLDKVDVITLRDRRSKAALDEMGIKGNIYVTADPVFGIENINSDEGRKLLCRMNVAKDAQCMGISVRPNKKMNDEILKNIAAAADKCAEKYKLLPVIIPMQKNKDEGICRRLSGFMKSENIVLPLDLSLDEILSVVSNMKLCIGMRLHTLIYSAVEAIPVIGLVYDPKVSGFMEYSNQDLYLNIDEISESRLTELIDKLMADYDNIKIKLEKTCCEMKKQTDKNVIYMKELLERKE